MDPTTSTPTAVIPASRSQRRTPTTGSGGREDCWSEGATDTLIEAWGDRYASLNRGNLRQKDWKEVADAVNSRDNGAKSQRTDVQCKNRIDTLKKKYKIEKAKPPPSTWRFFRRLDSLIGSANASKKPITTVTLTVRSAAKANLVKQDASNSTDEEFDEEDDDGGDDDGGGDDDDLGFDERVKKKQHRMEDVDFSDGAACRELARAILKFGEIYERVESSKQHQMMELEKQRMEFTKELEFERMNMLMDAQLELVKQSLKRPSSGKKS